MMNKDKNSDITTYAHSTSEAIEFPFSGHIYLWCTIKAICNYCSCTHRAATDKLYSPNNGSRK